MTNARAAELRQRFSLPIDPIAIVLMLFAFLCPSLTDAQQDAATNDDGAGETFFAEKVAPLLEARCSKCHGPADRREEDEAGGGLLLTSRASLLAGGDSGAGIIPGKPAESLLIDAINWGDVEMPPDSKLPAGEIAILTRWVEMGAPWPSGSTAAEPEKKEFPLSDRKAAHWAWQAVQRPSIPQINDADWPASDLDRFVLKRLEEAGLKPAPSADRRTLLRRAYFDVIGLPPEPAEIREFLADTRPTSEAFADVVDRLLASPHFGERWGRHWLDLMRYAESRGHEFDHDAANAYQYRDYVIRALNADVPYDNFVIEHLAGDLISKPRIDKEDGFNESVLGTGFWYLGDWVHSPVDIRRDETDRVDNMIDTLGRAFLGLTIACARCHDHKFDAISTADYYALAGYVQSSQYRQVRFDTIEHNGAVARELWALRKEQSGAIRDLLSKSFEPGVEVTDRYVKVAMASLGSDGEDKTAATSDSQLDRDRVAKWTAEIRTAAKDAQHPLHLWAATMAQTTNKSDDERNRIATDLVEERRGELDRFQQAFSKVRIVTDYATIDGEFWQDGYAFGTGAALPGDLVVTRDGESPRLQVQTRGAARRDLIWSGLKRSAGTQNEPGAVGKMQRSGQTLRTPTFSIDTGVVQYLVRGAAMVQAVVDSHRLIAGPLHGNLVRSFDSGEQTQWVRHDLQRYKGHRAHLEFVPQGDKPLEVFMVADHAGAIPMPPNVSQIACSALNVSDSDVGLSSMIRAAFRRFASGMVAAAEEPTGSAELVNWMLRNPDLFADARSPQIQATEQKAARLLEDEQSLASKIKKSSRTAIAICDGSAEDEFLLIRGNSSNPGDAVPRRFLEAIGGDGSAAPRLGSGRLELASQFVDAENNPLISRVIVNRIWHHLFGRGIVQSVDNFGVLGQLPSHPELLDHLAHRFVDNGWSMKKAIREMMLSSTYQKSSKPSDPRAEEADPDVILLHRMRVRRLQGEAIRDAILAISGRLDRTIGGLPVPVYLTSFMTGRGRPRGGPLDGDGRRSIYISIRRNFLSPMMLAFDMPLPSHPVGRRNVSNVPAQPLILLNDPLVVEQSRVWADRVLRVPDLSPDERIGQMYEAAFGRSPTDPEVQRGIEFLVNQAKTRGIADDRWQTDRKVWADYGHVLWNVKEFIFVN